MRTKLSLLLLSTLTLGFSSPSFAAQDFDAWLNDFRAEAISKGISKEIVDEATKDIKPIPRVIELDRKQPEGTMTFAQYKKKIVSDLRISQGRKAYKENRALLEKTAKEYGVPAQYLVALWGIETSYGKITGGFNIVPALATLAHDGRRSAFFRKELINALKILDAGHIAPAEMKGSWAGAMGQNQFMPSSFHSFAVDGNADGKRNIWTSLPDVFASSANYLSKSGWKEDERWGRRVRISRIFSRDLIGLDVKHSLATWKKLGVMLPSGEPIPVVDGMEASLVAPDGISGEVYLVYDNYRTIMKWNKSTYFATSVGLLADEILRGIND